MTHVSRKRANGLGWGIHVNPWLIHVNVWQKPLQSCKVISLQLIKINEKKRANGIKTRMRTWLGNNWIPSKGTEFWHLKDQFIWLGRSWAPPLFHPSQLLKSSPGQFGVSPLWERSCWERDSGRVKRGKVEEGREPVADWASGRGSGSPQQSILQGWLSGTLVPWSPPTGPQSSAATMEFESGKQEHSVMCVWGSEKHPTVLPREEISFSLTLCHHSLAGY